MSNEVIIILMFVVLVVGLIGLGAHLAFVLGAVGIMGGLLGWEGFAFFYLFPARIWAICHNFILVAVPLFVFMGYMMEKAGFGEALFGGVEVFFGKVRGGMAITVIIITTAIAATTGIVATGVIMAGVLALPVMLRRGYNKGLALGTVAAGGTLGQIIPPSGMMIFYASQTGLSVGKLFLGGFGPGLVLSVLFIMYIALITAIRPKMAPRLGEVPERAEYGLVERPATRHPRLRTLLAFLPVIFIIVAVMGSIVAGIATPTEAAASGALSTIIIAAIYRKLSFRIIWNASLSTAGTMGMFGAIIIGAMCFTAIFAGLGGREIVSEFLLGLGLPPLGVLLAIIGTIFILGMFVDPIGILLILIPTVVPIADIMGWDQLWFGLIFIITLQTAWLSPPFGLALFFLRGLNLPGITFGQIASGCVPFIFLQLVGVVICIAFPQVCLWLPNLLIR